MDKKYSELLREAADRDDLVQIKGDFFGKFEETGVKECCSIGAIAIQIGETEVVHDIYQDLRDKYPAYKRSLNGYTDCRTPLTYWNDVRGYSFKQIARMLQLLKL